MPLLQRCVRVRAGGGKVEASRLINTEEWSVIYSHDLVGCYAAEVRGFLLSLLCNQSGTTLHMYTEDLAVLLDFDAPCT